MKKRKPAKLPVLVRLVNIYFKNILYRIQLRFVEGYSKGFTLYKNPIFTPNLNPYRVLVLHVKILIKLLRLKLGIGLRVKMLSNATIPHTKLSATKQNSTR